MNIHSYHASARLLCQDEKTETQINKMRKGNSESAKHADALRTRSAERRLNNLVEAG